VRRASEYRAGVEAGDAPASARHPPPDARPLAAVAKRRSAASIGSLLTIALLTGERPVRALAPPRERSSASGPALMSRRAVRRRGQALSLCADSATLGGQPRARFATQTATIMVELDCRNHVDTASPLRRLQGVPLDDALLRTAEASGGICDGPRRAGGCCGADDGPGQVYMPMGVGDGVVTSRSSNVKPASRARRTGQVSATFSRRLTWSSVRWSGRWMVISNRLGVVSAS
jgi:hypothetical protein